MIKAEGLYKRYKDTVAVNDVDLEINDGELFALLGTNGAGKTTTIKMLSTLIECDRGKIEIDGLDVKLNKNEIRKILNVSPQETSIGAKLTVEENLRFMAGVYGISKSNETIKKLVDEFDLGEVLHKKAHKLSGGWQRKLSIALSLINNPRLLFLDEPTLGLDVLSRRELWREIKRLKGERTVVLTTHYLEEAEQLCDRVGIMAKGRLIKIGTVEEIKAFGKSDSFEDAFVNIVEGGDRDEVC